MEKRLNWIWLPLMMSIFGLYAIQRGFSVFAKAADFPIPHVKEALAIYFTVMSIAILIGGYLLDNRPTREIILIATFLGIIGVLLLQYSALGFGLVFGSAGALLKLAPFSAPMKLFNKNEGIKVWPQAAAKNLGGAAFILFLGAALMKLGWVYSSYILCSVFLASGIAAYLMLPNDKIEGWNWGIFKEVATQGKFWGFCLYSFFMCGFYYLAVMEMYPGLKAAGIDPKFALTILAISFLCCGALRYPSGWLGHQEFKGFKIRLPLMWITTAGMGISIPLVHYNAYLGLTIFTICSAFQTPNYWTYVKENWGATYVSTVQSLGFVAQYIGVGMMYGKW